MIDWLRWRLGRPTLHDVARAASRALAARGATDIAWDEPLEELRYRLDGASGPGMMTVGNLHRDVLGAPRRRRDAVVARFVETVCLVPRGAPADWASARPRLYPIVRTESDDGIALLTLQRHAAAGRPPAPVASRPLAGDLVRCLAVDSDNAMQRVTEEQLRQWGVDFDHAMAEALQNLRGLPEHGGWRALAPGLWSGAWGDSYESSRILLPDLIHRLGVPEPVVLMPLRSSLLVASARHEAALAAMAATARALLESQGRWLSVTPLALGADGWTPFVPPPALARAFEDLHCIETASSYDSQQPLLEQHYRHAGVDVFVARATLARRQSDEALVTYAVWPRGVDTVLPRTRRVALVLPVNPAAPGPGDETLMVPWDALWTEAAALLEPTGHRPPRFRTRGFPDEASLARLRATVAAAS